MIRNIVLISFLVLISDFSLHAQIKRNVEALRIESALIIDGKLEENCYSKALPAKDFVQLNPYNGQPSRQPSEVWFFYSQDAVYIGAMLYDSSPDSIFNFLTERDELGIADYFGVYLDPYNQGQLAYGFFITPAGVQMDMKAIKGEFDNEDEGWDAVWESATSITDKGWIVEMKIPYSALRIPDVPEHIWGMNMFRRIRRYNSNNSWSLINREISGFIDQQGQLTGIRNIKPPIRLSLSPYAAAYMEMKGESARPDFIYKAGMDLKYGINESFTLDMMLVPDFGQIQSDDKELNLSPYELFYDEKRQFFTEGTEMFSRAGIFYSRRIGAAPKFAYRATDDLRVNEEINYSPSETQLLNATKISGRTSNGLGMGFLNAMTLPSHARLIDTLSGNTREILVQPFTNYNVSVIDKSLKNNSYMSLINTNVSMAGDPFFANTTAYDIQLRNKQKTYAFTSQGGISLRREDSLETGYGIGLGVKRIKGKFKYGVEQLLFSDKLNINDLGYLKRNNEVNTSAYFNYNLTEPFSIFNEVDFHADWNLIRVYNPWKLAGNEFEGSVFALFKNNYVCELLTGYNTKVNDYYEPHVKGRFFRAPAHGFISAYIGTDSRKALRGDLEFTTYKQVDAEGKGIMLEPEISLRLGQRFRLGFESGLNNSYKEFGFADVTDDEDSIYFAKRNVNSLENIIEASYVLNNKMGINLRLRHYWSGDKNLVYYQLQPDGTLTEEPSYNINHDQNYNAFTIDMRFRWIFAPGSELSLAWKNTIYNDTEIYQHDYFDNLSDTWNLGQTNSISLKILYYIDYNHLVSRK